VRYFLTQPCPRMFTQHSVYYILPQYTIKCLFISGIIRGRFAYICTMYFLRRFVWGGVSSIFESALNVC
jgi:hypothetical protein